MNVGRKGDWKINRQLDSVAVVQEMFIIGKSWGKGELVKKDDWILWL